MALLSPQGLLGDLFSILLLHCPVGLVVAGPRKRIDTPPSRMGQIRNLAIASVDKNEEQLKLLCAISGK